jgi:hypothetical protein
VTFEKGQNYDREDLCLYLGSGIKQQGVIYSIGDPLAWSRLDLVGGGGDWVNEREIEAIKKNL